MGEDDFRAAMSDVEPLKPRLTKKARHRETLLAAEKDASREATTAQIERRQKALGIRPDPNRDPNPLTLEEVAQLAPRDMLAWKKDGVQHQVFSRLQNGHYTIEGSLDLHGMSVREARTAVWKFFRMAVEKRWRTVLIAHGRGERSATPARLKSYVIHWLGQLPQVIAYTSADGRHGGTGAVLVLLKKSAAAREEAREAYGQKSLPHEG